MGWILLKAATGKRMLLNDITIFAIVEGDGGAANAVSIAGGNIALGDDFDEVLADLDELQGVEDGQDSDGK